MREERDGRLIPMGVMPHVTLPPVILSHYSYQKAVLEKVVADSLFSALAL